MKLHLCNSYTLRYFNIIWIVISLLSPALLFSQDTLVIDKLKEKEAISIKAGDYYEILEDESHESSFREILALESHRFVPYSEFPKPFHYKKTYWGRVTLVSPVKREYFVTFIHAQDAEIYLLYPDGNRERRKVGRFVKRSELAVAQSHSQVKIQFEKNVPITVYARAKPCYTNTPVKFVLWVNSSKNFWEDVILNRDMAQAVFHGAIWIMILYHFFLWLTSRDKTYAIYILYMVSLSVALFRSLKMELTLLPPLGEFPYQLMYVEVLTSQTIGATFLLFAKYFLNTKKLIPKWDKVIVGYIWFRFLMVPLVLYCNLVLFPTDMVENWFYLFELFFMVAVTIRLYFTKDLVAKWFVLGTSILLAFNAVSVLGWLKLIDWPLSDLYVQVGVLAQLVLFSLGLGYRARLNDKKRRAVQQQYIEQLEKNEKLQKDINQKLEVKVKARTQELSNKNEELQETLNKLQTTQTQLVESEKMASLGQLTAGIAHEINNPINFVSANIGPLKNDFKDIKELLEKYQSVRETKEVALELERILEFEEEIEVDYLYEEIETLLKGIQEGAARTKEIVLGLRNFSRLDEDDFKAVNLQEGIDSTLVLLKTKMQNKAEVIKEYGSLPLVECQAGKINQVFMNLISNAIDAFEEKGKIYIKTFLKNENAIISIRDTGRGMTEEVKKRIFEPFYTTKDVGEGTGLGLAISYGIIENHNGSIKVSSQPGKGTEFTIKLPVKQKENGIS